MRCVRFRWTKRACGRRSWKKSGADLAYIMPSHQFPMGMVMPMKRRMQLLAWASRENGRYLIEDDYDSEFRYKGRPIPALQGNDTEGKVIYLGTFSRAIAPSIRISYMVLPETLLPAYEENGRCFSATVSKTDQKILEEFMRSGAFERHLNRMRAQYKGKHDLLIRLLKEILGGSTRCPARNAGVHVLVHLPRGLSEAEAVQLGKRGWRARVRAGTVLHRRCRRSRTGRHSTAWVRRAF